MIENNKKYFEVIYNGNNSIDINFYGKINTETVPLIIDKLFADRRVITSENINVDISFVDLFDDFGTLILYKLKKITKQKNGKFSVIKNKTKSDEIAELANVIDNSIQLRTKKKENIFVKIGNLFIELLVRFKYTITFFGSLFTSFLYIFFKPKSFRLKDTIVCMEKTGVDAIPIVTLTSFLLGLIIAFMSSLQLKQFGATIYVASLVALAMVSELGPIMTAIVVAGRSSSAFAAEIGTMKISEEVDALYSMGFNVTYFLVIPRMLASVIVVPILTIFSSIFAILGGLFVGVTILNLSVNAYLNQTFKVITFFEIWWGVLKSCVFALIISWVGCLRGFQAKGGASAVGNAATSAVVTSIFFIILIDSIFAVLRSYFFSFGLKLS